MKNWPIVKPLISLLFSRKFLVLFVAALASSGLAAAADLADWIPIIVMIGAAVMTTLTAWEDASAKRGLDAEMLYKDRTDENENN